MGKDRRARIAEIIPGFTGPTNIRLEWARQIDALYEQEIADLKMCLNAEADAVTDQRKTILARNAEIATLNSTVAVLVELLFSAKPLYWAENCKWSNIRGWNMKASNILANLPAAAKKHQEYVKGLEGVVEAFKPINKELYGEWMRRLPPEGDDVLCTGLGDVKCSDIVAVEDALKAIGKGA